MAFGGLFTAIAIAYGTLNLVDLLSHTVSTRQFSFPAVSTLDVRTDGSITVRVGAAGTISVARRVEHGLRAPHPSAAVSGDSLVLTGTCPNVINQWCHVSYSVEVPRGTRVIADARSGHLTVEPADGDLVVSSPAA